MVLSVLFHGTAAWSELWRHTTPALAASGFHVIALDLPPFGFSDRPGSYTRQDQATRINDVLIHLKAAPAIIVGHSFGAGAATELAMRYPDRARALVLVDAALGLTAAPSDAPWIIQPKWIREVLVSLTINNPVATKMLLESLIEKKERALPEFVAILQRPTTQRDTTPDIADWLYYFLGGSNKTGLRHPSRNPFATVVSGARPGERNVRRTEIGENAMRHLLRSIALIAGIVGSASPSTAKILKLEIVRMDSPAFEGRSFGAVGTYDRIVARATIAVAPDDPHNSVIVDIDRAPHNPQGVVRAVADVEILRPTVAANGNRRLLYDVVNRGNKSGLALFNDSPSVVNDLVKASDGGNGFLMSRGYTLVWSGWQGDVTPGGGRMTFSPPVVPDVTGLAREDFIFDHMNNPAVATLSYPAADLDPSHARISVRQREADPRATPAGLEVTFDGPTRISIKRPDGFDAGAIYEFIYTAKDPKVMGLGFAATRDIVSFLRYEAADSAGTANPVAGRIDRAIGFGLSQSGRYLHDYLYLGFNADEANRVVFEGLMPHISGGKKTFTNYRFSQPGRSPYQHADMLYPGADFPFTYPVIADTLTGKTDGFLKRCLTAGNCPKIIKSDSEIEFYQQRASLVVTDTGGNALAMPDNVRLFFLSNLQHNSPANAKSEMAKTCAFPTNPLNAGPPLRALLVVLDAWISNGTPPPASRYPSRADGTLAPPAIDEVGFPRVPGFGYPVRIAQPTLLKADEMPPSKASAYPVFVPKTNADGRAVAGLHLPTLEVPSATHTGWNLRKAGFAEGELCDNNGSMIPFAATKDERLKTGDPRLSMAERYPNQGDRAAAIAKAAQQLVQDRLLLEEDVKLYTPNTN